MTLLLLCLLTASPAKIAAPGLAGSEVSDVDLATYSDRLYDTLNRRGAVVMTSDAIDVQLGESRPKCPPTTHACMTQLGHALSADAVLTGTIRNTGFDLQIDLELLTRKGGLTPWSGRAASSSQALTAMSTAGELFGDVLELKRPRTLRGSKWWVPGVSGIGLLAVSGIFALLTRSDAAQLEGQGSLPSTLTLAQANGVYAQGKAFETISLAALALGSVGLIVSVLWFFVTTSPAP